MNDVKTHKTGIVLVRVSRWCGLLALRLIVIFFLLLLFILVLQLSPHEINFLILFILSLIIFVFSILAILSGHCAQLIFLITRSSHADSYENIRSGLLLGYSLFISYCLVCFIILTIEMKWQRDEPLRSNASNNLKHLYILMCIYEQDYGSLPKITSEGGNGVRDLYPLYSSGILDDEALNLLQPTGCALRPLRDPSTNDFNRYTIGFFYNSTAKLDDPDNPPLLADQGVSSGRLRLNTKDRGIKPRRENGALVLFADGTVDFIPVVNKRGKLSTSKVSLEEWELLKD